MATIDINPFTRKPVQQEGRVIELAGTTGTGKTTFIKETISKAPLPKYIFDIDGEYKMFKNYGKPINRSIGLMENIQLFKKQVAPLWESVIVFSEAGLLFAHGEANDLEMRELFKSARRRGNLLLLDYHALSEIPIETLRYTNYLVLKKNVMQTKSQLNKFAAYPEILNKLRKCAQSTDNFHTEVIIPRELDMQY